MNTNRRTTAVMEALARYLRERGQRLTSERMAVVEVMVKYKGPFTVDQLYKQIEVDAFPVSRATVYNTVKVMLEAGMLENVRMPGADESRYMIGMRDRSHIFVICNSCGKVRELSASALGKTINNYDFGAFLAGAFSLSVYGQCRKCAQKNRQKN